MVADTSCDLEMNFVLIALKATAHITLAVKAEIAFPVAAVLLSVTKKKSFSEKIKHLLHILTTYI